MSLRKVGRPRVRPNRFTISVSDESFEIVERYCELLGISKAQFIDSIIAEGREQHLQYLEELEELKRKFTK